MKTFRELYEKLREAGSASDFPVIMGNQLHRILLAAYNGVQSSWRTWCYINTTIKDFKPNIRFRITDVEDLLQIPWGQPGKQTSFDEFSLTISSLNHLAFELILLDYFSLPA